jgi:hypothetical protein
MIIGTSVCSDDRGEAVEGMMVRVERVSLLKSDGPLRAFQLAHPQIHRWYSVRESLVPNYDGRSSNGSYGAQTDWVGGVDRQWSAAMRCAAGERALFTAETQIAGRRASSNKEPKRIE